MTALDVLWVDLGDGLGSLLREWVGVPSASAIFEGAGGYPR
jgi:hypothetical protein